MPVRVTMAVSLFAGGFAVLMPLCAQDSGEVRLQFKAFDPGSRPFYQFVETTDIQVTPPGLREVIESHIVRWTPQPAEGKHLVVKRQVVSICTITRVGVHGSMTGSSDVFPGSGRTPGPTTAVYDAVKGVELTLVIDSAAMKVKEIRGRRHAVDKLTAAHPDYRDIVQAFLAEEALMDVCHQPWFGLPRMAAAKGSVWREPVLIETSLCSYEGIREFKYDGHDAGKDRINVSPLLSFKLPLVPDRIKKGSYLHCKESESHGSIVFDRKLGRVVEASAQVTMAGVLLYEIGGREARQDVVHIQKVRCKTSEEKLVIP